MNEEEMKIEEEVKKVIISTPSNNPESIESGRRNSSGKVSIKKTPSFSSREKKVEPRYLRNSTGSCHDVCKHGKSHTFELHRKRFPARRSFPHGDKDKESTESKDSTKSKGIFQTKGKEIEQKYLVDISKYPPLEKESVESSSPKEKRMICHEVVQPLDMPENISDGSVISNDIVAPFDISDNMSVESVVCHEVIAPINMPEETFDRSESLDTGVMKAASVTSEAETMKSSARSRTPNLVEKPSKKLVKKPNASEDKKRELHCSVLRKAKEKNLEFKGKSITTNKRTQLLAETNKTRVLEKKGDPSSIMKPTFTISPERISKATSTPKVTTKKMVSTTVKKSIVSLPSDETIARSASTFKRPVPSKPKTSLITSTSVLVPSRKSTAQNNAKMVVKSIDSALKTSRFSKAKVQAKGKEIEKPKENVIEKTLRPIPPYLKPDNPFQPQMDPNSSTKLQTHDSIKSSHGYPVNNKIMMAAVVVLLSIVLLILAVHLYVRYFIYRRRNSLHNRRLAFSSGAVAQPRGLDSKVLNSIPVVVYDADVASDDEAVECAVCLCEIEDGEKVRILPRCEHRFHVGCIDMWFGSHGSCPLCRTAVDDVVAEPKIEQLCTEGEAGSSSSDESFVSIEIEDEEVAETGSSTVDNKSNFVDLVRNYFSRSRRLNGNDDVATVPAEV